MFTRTDKQILNFMLKLERSKFVTSLVKNIKTSVPFYQLMRFKKIIFWRQLFCTEQKNYLKACIRLHLLFLLYCTLVLLIGISM